MVSLLDMQEMVDEIRLFLGRILRWESETWHTLWLCDVDFGVKQLAIVVDKERIIHTFPKENINFTRMTKHG